MYGCGIGYRYNIENKTRQPLLYQSTNGGAWEVIPTTTHNGEFYSTSCTVNYSSSICTSVGYDSTTNKPLLYQSTNGGAWEDISTTNVNGTFNSTSCTININESGSKCTAAGIDMTGQPLLYQSINGGKWTAFSPKDSGNLSLLSQNFIKKRGQVAFNHFKSISKNN